MNEDLSSLRIKPIRNNQFAHWFQDVKYNGKTLCHEERTKLVDMLDKTKEEYSKGFSIMQDIFEHFNDCQNELHHIYQTIVSVMIFVLITQMDIMVANKYFILADKDYDRRYFRGKLKVLQNEGFKRLYGFEKKTYKKSEWEKLLSLMKYFPEEINRQFQELTYLLQKQSKSSSWWEEERNLETHMDAVKLYHSRQEELIESKVIMDSMKLYCTLMAVSDYLANLHTCLYNYLVEKYQRGELKDE